MPRKVTLKLYGPPTPMVGSETLSKTNGKTFIGVSESTSGVSTILGSVLRFSPSGLDYDRSKITSIKIKMTGRRANWNGEETKNLDVIGLPLSKDASSSIYVENSPGKAVTLEEEA